MTRRLGRANADHESRRAALRWARQTSPDGSGFAQDPFKQGAHDGSLFVSAPEGIGQRPGTTGILDILRPLRYSHQASGYLTPCTPQTHLKNQGVLVRMTAQYLGQRGVGYEAPSQYQLSPMRTGGNPGGKAPEAMKYSGVSCYRVLSKYSKLPLCTLTAPTDTRMSPELMRTKSAISSSVLSNGEVS